MWARRGLVALVGVACLAMFLLGLFTFNTDVRHTAVDMRLATSDTWSTTADTRPTTADTRPTTADTRPTTADTRPTTADTRPTTADTRPTTADTRPTTADMRPTATGLNSGVTGTVPTSATTPTTAVHSERWIVVTSVHQPSDAMRVLCNLAGWQTVVVADNKSPPDWSEGRCIYLSVQDQVERLPFSIVPLTPFRSYTRKNIGYLYAIQHGAQVIFDTDDDNRPRGLHVHELGQTDYNDLVSWRRNDSDILPVGNVYAHFGWPHIWPRGYPLAPPRDLDHPISLPSSPVQSMTPPDVTKGMLKDGTMIVQGLADLDPDVDAVFRLTHPQDVGHVRFCANVPPLRLEPGLYSPFNSQNTLFYRNTLWALLLPTTVTFRVCDIWRAYWAQRLLWDIGGTLVFQGSTVDQVRNSHDLHADREDERMLYDDAERFVRLLDRWTPSPGAVTLPARMIELAEHMVLHKLMDTADVALMRAWVADLAAVGYIFPSLVDRAPPDSAAKLIPIPPPIVQRMYVCSLRRAWAPTLHPKFKDVLLICHLNHKNHYGVIPTYLDHYAPAFPNIVVTGQIIDVSPVPYDIYGYITYDDSDPRLRGDSQHRGFLHIYHMFPQFKGYLWSNDDTLVNYWRMKNLDLTRFWYHDRTVLFTQFAGCYDVGRWPEPSKWHWHWNKEIHQKLDRFTGWLDRQRRANVTLATDPTSPAGHLCDPAAVNSTAITPTLNTTAQTPGQTFYMYHHGSDFIYVPHESVNARARLFIELLEIFASLDIAFMEIAFPTALFVTVPPEEQYAIRAVYNWDTRDTVARVLLWTQNDGLEVFHPVKFGGPAHNASHLLVSVFEWARTHAPS